MKTASLKARDTIGQLYISEHGYQIVVENENIHYNLHDHLLCVEDATRADGGRRGDWHGVAVLCGEKESKRSYLAYYAG